MKISLHSLIADLSQQKEESERVKRLIKITRLRSSKKKKTEQRPVGHHRAYQHTHNKSFRREKKGGRKRNQEIMAKYLAN